MDKEEIIALIESLKFPKAEFYILSSGCLLFYGLRERASDLDLCISDELFNRIKDKYCLTEDKKNSCGFYKLSDKIEVVVNKKEEFKHKYDVKFGYQLQKLELILDYKKKRNLPKDRLDIENIEKYLMENK